MKSISHLFLFFAVSTMCLGCFSDKDEERVKTEIMKCFHEYYQLSDQKDGTYLINRKKTVSENTVMYRFWSTYDFPTGAYIKIVKVEVLKDSEITPAEQANGISWKGRVAFKYIVGDKKNWRDEELIIFARINKGVVERLFSNSGREWMSGPCSSDDPVIH